MNKNFNLEDYKNKRVVVLCKTQEEATEFCNYLHNNGKKWGDGNSYPERTYWEDYKKDTCYDFNNGQYSSKDWYKERGYIILEWENYMNGTQKELKIGDRVQFKTWHTMMDEYGGKIYCNGEVGICTKIPFLYKMKHLCGTFATIKYVKGEKLYLENFTSPKDNFWLFTTDMVKPAKQINFKELSDDYTGTLNIVNGIIDVEIE